MQGYRRARAPTSSSEQADEVVIKEILAGNQEGFPLLVCRYEGLLFRYILHYLRDVDLAWDILQNVFLQLYLSLPNLGTHGSLKAWLYQVSRNRCVDELRRKRPLPFSLLEVIEEDEVLSSLASLQDPDPLPQERVEREEVRLLLLQAIEGLPPKYRAVVLLRYRQWRYCEISITLQMSEASARTYFQRARPLLRAALTSLSEAG